MQISFNISVLSPSTFYIIKSVYFPDRYHWVIQDQEVHFRLQIHSGIPVSGVR